MKKIILATDFSPRAEAAMEYSIHFLKNVNAELLLLHVVEPRIDMIDPMVMGSNLLQVELDASKERMKREVEQCKSLIKELAEKKITVKAKVTSGLISEVIKEEALEMEANGIIMGTHGTNYHFLEKVIGTIANGVISNAPCPVILVPAEYRFKNIDNVLFATNLAESDIEKLHIAAKLISPHTSIIRCLHVSKDEKGRTSEKVANFSKKIIDQSPSVQTLFYTEVSEDIESVITEYAEAYDTEFIIMTKSKKSIIQRLFGHSATQQVTYKLHVPLMVIN